jgi:hypothetical protein
VTPGFKENGSKAGTGTCRRTGGSWEQRGLDIDFSQRQQFRFDFRIHVGHFIISPVWCAFLVPFLDSPSFCYFLYPYWIT